jgi:ERCC4-type nuclease
MSATPSESASTIEIADFLISSSEPGDVVDEVKKVLTKRGWTVSDELLPTDYMIPGNPGLAIERKEMGDLINTWFSEDERLSNQLETLKMLEKANYKPALLIVGNMTEALSKRKGGQGKKQANRQSITNLLNGLPFSWGIPVCRCDFAWQVPYTLEYLRRKFVLGEKTAVPFRHTAAKEYTPKQKASYLVQGLPGCGVKTTEKIQQNTVNFMDFVERLTNERFLMDADPDGDHEIKYLTKKQKDAMYEVLETPWREAK